MTSAVPLDGRTVWSSSNPYEYLPHHALKAEPRSAQDDNHSSSNWTSRNNAPGAASSAKPTSEALNIESRRYTVTSPSAYQPDNLPFFGPPDPDHWPMEKLLFFAGFLFFPCWIFGGLWRRGDRYDKFAELFRWRCQVMTMFFVIIGGGLIIVETAFRGR